VPCDTRLAKGQTPEQRKRQVEAAVKRLEAALLERRAKVVIGPNGALAFTGEWDREGVGDLCAYRRLASAGSFALRKAIAAAEVTAGRKLNEAAIGAGMHSHDHGRTWGSD